LYCNCRLRALDDITSISRYAFPFQSFQDRSILLPQPLTEHSYHKICNQVHFRVLFPDQVNTKNVVPFLPTHNCFKFAFSTSPSTVFSPTAQIPSASLPTLHFLYTTQNQNSTEASPVQISFRGTQDSCPGNSSLQLRMAEMQTFDRWRRWGYSV